MNRLADRRRSESVREAVQEYVTRPGAYAALPDRDDLERLRR